MSCILIFEHGKFQNLVKIVSCLWTSSMKSFKFLIQWLIETCFQISVTIIWYLWNHLPQFTLDHINPFEHILWHMRCVQIFEHVKERFIDQIFFFYLVEIASYLLHHVGWHWPFHILWDSFVDTKLEIWWPMPMGLFILWDVYCHPRDGDIYGTVMTGRQLWWLIYHQWRAVNVTDSGPPVEALKSVTLTALTHWDPVTHIFVCAFELSHHWYRYWLVPCYAPSHYLN